MEDQSIYVRNLHTVVLHQTGGDLSALGKLIWNYTHLLVELNELLRN